MANYYTTRFNPIEWPPHGGEIPAGVEWNRDELVARELACCSDGEVQEISSHPLEEKWAYRSVYRTLCPLHGERLLQVENRLDWISPNEYLLSVSVCD